MAANEYQKDWAFRIDTGWGGSKIEEGISVGIICNCKRLYVDLLPAGSPDGTKLRSLIERWQAAFTDLGDEKLDAAQEEFYEILNSVGRPVIAQLAPPIAMEDRSKDLHSLLYPETFFFRLVTINGEAVLELDPDHEPPYPELPWKVNNDLGLTTYSSKDIHVVTKYLGEGDIAQVLVNGQEMCYKHAESSKRQAVERELNCLQKIAQSQHASSLRVEKLTGLVTSADNGQMIGILEEHIPKNEYGELVTLRANNKYGELVTLRDVDASIVAHSRRKKWAAQVREMVDQLHEIGVVWGDGKPANVLVHRDTDDAWLIDFGGSWTEGWVDAGLMETEEGDEQAVERIVKFLDV